MKIIISVGMVLALVLQTATGCAADFPIAGKPVRIVVGLAPGGPTDIQARAVALYVQKELGSPVLVENKPGASLMIATIAVAQALPDGHTLLYSPSTPFAQNPHTLANLAYDPFKDFTPISLGSVGPLVLVAHTSLGAENLAQLVEHAKANPGRLSYGSFGTGSSSHLFGQLFSKQYGLDMVHIPYKGAGDVQKDLVAGRVQLMFAAAGGAVQFVRSGKIRMIGVAAPQRTELLPGVSTLSEQGAAGLDINGWVGFFGPAKMSPATVSRLNAALANALAIARVKDEFAKGAYEAVSSSPAEFAAMVKDSYDKWGKVVSALGVRKE